MTSLQSFINNTVIPENWKVLSSRLDTSNWTIGKQRMKIIGEIVEYFEARQLYMTTFSPEAFALMLDELADVILSCCTIIKLQDRPFSKQDRQMCFDEEHWIRKVLNREIDATITAVFEYAETMKFDLRGSITKKMAYNAQRKDW